MKALLIVGIVVAVAAVVLGLSSWTTVPAGHVSVVTSFGKVSGEPLEPGFHWVAFWKKTHSMSIQTQEVKEVAQRLPRKA